MVVGRSFEAVLAAVLRACFLSPPMSIVRALVFLGGLVPVVSPVTWPSMDQQRRVVLDLGLRQWWLSLFLQRWCSLRCQLARPGKKKKKMLLLQQQKLSFQVVGHVPVLQVRHRRWSLHLRLREIGQPQQLQVVVLVPVWLAWKKLRSNQLALRQWHRQCRLRSGVLRLV